ncbi:hypothetical protein DAI22_04g284400 [Oryza sativa Japonica Group]|nr:hypothetical protein DAI22_04g284400 [Oryza sativa Japonica Group]
MPCHAWHIMQHATHSYPPVLLASSTSEFLHRGCSRIRDTPLHAAPCYATHDAVLLCHASYTSCKPALQLAETFYLWRWSQIQKRIRGRHGIGMAWCSMNVCLKSELLINSCS